MEYSYGTNEKSDGKANIYMRSFIYSSKKQINKNSFECLGTVIGAAINSKYFHYAEEFTGL